MNRQKKDRNLGKEKQQTLGAVHTHTHTHG